MWVPRSGQGWLVDDAAPTALRVPAALVAGRAPGVVVRAVVSGRGEHPGQSARREPEVVIDGVDHEPRPAQRGDAELGVGLGPQRVVDLGDDPLDAELLGRELGGHDVPVVAFGQGQEDVGALGAGPLEDVLVGAVATDRRAAERGRQPIEGGGGTVDDEHLMTRSGRRPRRRMRRLGRIRR